MTKPSDYLSVLVALKEELARPDDYPGKQTVIQACETYLRLNKPPLFTTFADITSPLD